METRQEAQGGLSVEERIASWKGERIVLIAKPGESSMGSARNLHKKGNSRTALRADLYDGKTGAIVDTEYDGFWYQLVIQLDEPAEELVYGGASTRSGIAFASELKMIHGLAGETVWSQGELRLKKPGNKGGFLSLAPGTPLRILDGRMTYHEPVFKVRTADGQEGEVRLAWPQDCLEQRLHPRCERDWKNTRSFYVEDPRRLFPRWSNNTWKKIKSHEVWPGMTFAMLEAVCGSDLRLIGGQLEGGKIHDVYRCHSKKVMVSSSKNIVLKWELQ